MKHKKTSEIRQNLRNKWIESLQTNLSVLYKITGTSPVSKQHFIKRCKHLVTFNHLSSDYIMIIGSDNVHQQQPEKTSCYLLATIGNMAVIS